METVWWPQGHGDRAVGSPPVCWGTRVLFSRSEAKADDRANPRVGPQKFGSLSRAVAVLRSKRMGPWKGMVLGVSGFRHYAPGDLAREGWSKPWSRRGESLTCSLFAESMSSWVNQTRERQRWIIGGFPPSVIVPISERPFLVSNAGEGDSLRLPGLCLGVSGRRLSGRNRCGERGVTSGRGSSVDGHKPDNSPEWAISLAR